MGSSRRCCRKRGKRVDRIKQIVLDELARLPKATGTQVGMNRSTQDVFTAAQKEADRLKDEYVSTEHLILVLSRKSKAKRRKFSASMR